MTISNLAAEPRQRLSGSKNLDYQFEGATLFSLPESLSYMLTAIEKSKFILSLTDNWDDEGSEKYSKTTWVAAIKFVLTYAKLVYRNFKTKIGIPKIYPGPKGSIDIMWETKTYRLVINVVKNGEEAMFYADDYKNQITEGTFKLDHFNPTLFPVAISK